MSGRTVSQHTSGMSHFYRPPRKATHTTKTTEVVQSGRTREHTGRKPGSYNEDGGHSGLSSGDVRSGFPGKGLWGGKWAHDSGRVSSMTLSTDG